MAEIVQKMQKATKGSKAEAWIRSSGVLIWEEARIFCAATNKQKQVDFVSPDRKIWVEVDGFWHFFPGNPENHLHVCALQKRQSRDAMLNEEALRRGNVMLIRLSGQCFRSSDGKMVEDWLDWLTAMLRSPQPGVWCCGGLYESVPWASSKCVILRSPIPSTTSFCPTAS
jgi:hypothetical protein